MDRQGLATKKKLSPKDVNKALCNQVCPVRDVLNYIGDKWSMLIILELGAHSPLRFGELKTAISGISQKMLTITLRQLEHDGFVERVYFMEVPPRVEYSITPLGESLMNALRNLVEWAKDNTEPILLARKKSEQLPA